MRRHIFPALILSMPIAIIFALILKLSGGQFTYTLDDPYIHLALAKHIWLGNYGINAIEPSAPSSSIIWPFLMAPFASVPAFFEYIPLIFNAVCTVLSGIILLNIFSKQSRWTATLIALLLMLSMNLYGLIFCGMEHSLQIVLVLYIVYGVIHPPVMEEDAPARLLFYVCVCLLPLVRYEGLAISMPVIAYAFLKGQRKQALLSFAVVMLALAAFSAYLNAKGLGFLPSSVLAKSAHAHASSTLQNLVSNIQKYGFMLVPVAMIIISNLPKNPAYALMIALVTGLHFLLGRHGWFGRYEVYFVLFVTVIALKQLTDSQPKMWWLVFVLPLPFANLVKATLHTPLASSNIHDQQIQMGEIVSILDENVAVNDLGVVALRSNHYVLDLLGLGSLEALKQWQSGGGDGPWVSELMHRKNVEHAIVYTELFPKNSAHWIKVAELKFLQEKITPAYEVVAFYSTSEAAAIRLKKAVNTFVRADRPGKFVVTVNEGVPN
jgi:hypothetical protein